MLLNIMYGSASICRVLHVWHVWYGMVCMVSQSGHSKNKTFVLDNVRNTSVGIYLSERNQNL
jgi:hypothetical protein